MKYSKLLYVFTALALTQTLTIKNESIISKGRAPASEIKANEVSEDEKELAQLQAKENKSEADQKRIVELKKKIEEKAKIAKDEEDRKKLTLSLCEAKTKQEQLQNDLKKALKDNEDVLKQLKDLRSEADELKKSHKEKEDKYSKVSMMEEMTNLLKSSADAQKLLQLQMFTMMNNQPMFDYQSMNFMPTYSSMRYSPYANPFTMALNPYSDTGFLGSYGANSWSNYMAYPRMNSLDNLFSHSNIGIGVGANYFGNSNLYHDNVFSSYTSERYPSSVANEPKVEVLPQIRGFDFSFSSDYVSLKQPELSQMERIIF